MGKDKTAITPTRAEDFPEWYQQVVRASDMAENSETRGCMVIKPWGFALWENIQSQLDARFKDTGHQNAYFPLLIPLSYLEKEAEEETRLIHGVYEEFLRDHLAIPVVPGEKTEAERFPGAINTYTIEAMVQDKKAIQAGTSHYLGQNFAKAQDITFTGRNGNTEHVHTTSWGVSTRLIGTLIMAHSDDDGLVLPPRVAPQQIVIVPVTPKEETREAVLESCEALAETLRREQCYAGGPVRVHVDKRDLGGGVKKWEWVKKGVPIRLEIGPRDLEGRKVCLQRRDQAPNEKDFVDREDFIRNCPQILAEIQQKLLERLTAFRDENIAPCDSLDDFKSHWTADTPGWLLTPWSGSTERRKPSPRNTRSRSAAFPAISSTGKRPLLPEWDDDPHARSLGPGLLEEHSYTRQGQPRCWKRDTPSPGSLHA